MAFCVYLLASRRHGTLYLGITGDLPGRIHQHKTKAASGFTSKYGVDRLVPHFPDRTTILSALSLILI
jgi:putative endonuclease